MDIFDTKDVSPMLIKEDKPAFDSPDWIYELKLDGIRGFAYLSPDGTELRNKRNKRVSASYPELSDVFRQAKHKCILDGEVLVLKEGKPYFAEVQRRALMTNPFKIRLAADKQPVCFTAYDILYSGDRQVTNLPLMERKALLDAAISESPRLAISRYIEEKGVDLYNATEAGGLEGIVAKKKDSLYWPGRETKDWVKCKALLDDDFVVCGYYHKDKRASVIIGMYHDGGLVYQGHVVIGTSNEDFKIMSSMDNVPKSKHHAGSPDFEGAVWLEPVLVCKVEFMERTSRGGLRQPVYRGLRDDKEPIECQLSTLDSL